MLESRRSTIVASLFLILLSQLSHCGCTFDDQFGDPAWQGKTWSEPDSGEKVNPNKVHGGII